MQGNKVAVGPGKPAALERWASPWRPVPQHLPCPSHPVLDALPFPLHPCCLPLHLPLRLPLPARPASQSTKLPAGSRRFPRTGLWSSGRCSVPAGPSRPLSAPPAPSQQGGLSPQERPFRVNPHPLAVSPGMAGRGIRLLLYSALSEQAGAQPQLRSGGRGARGPDPAAVPPVWARLRPGPVSLPPSGREGGARVLYVFPRVSRVQSRCARVRAVCLHTCVVLCVSVHVGALGYARESWVLDAGRGLLCGDEGLVQASCSQGALRRGRGPRIVRRLQRKVLVVSHAWEKCGWTLAVGACGTPERAESP